MIQLQIGTFVQIKRNRELFWCKVQSHDAGTGMVTGIVENELINNIDLSLGSILQFHKNEVRDSYSEDDMKAFARHLKSTEQSATVRSRMDFAILVEKWLQWRLEHRKQQ